jgi:hypothetical protein
MDFSISSLAAGFIYGVIGIYLVRQARKTANWAHFGIGMSLMIYPYFVTSAYLLWGIGAALLYVAYKV